MSARTREINIKEFDLDQISPGRDNWDDPKTTGSKIVIIGKPGTGKTQLISSILYDKSFIFPVGEIYSGTESENGYYAGFGDEEMNKKMDCSAFFPRTFLYEELKIDRMEAFKERQKIGKRYLKNPWAVSLVDDCTDDTKLLKDKIFHSYYKNGRHWKMLFILSLQYCMDILPVMRTNIDATFIMRETILRNRKALWSNYAGCIPDFGDFCDIMDQVTNDYTALVILNRVQSNNIEDCVFWYKATPPPKGWKFGCRDFWIYDEVRGQQQKKMENDEEKHQEH